MITKKDELAARREAIFVRIKAYYGKKLQRNISDTEAEELAANLLQFAKALYGTT